MTNICPKCVAKVPVGQLPKCPKCEVHVCYDVLKRNEHKCPSGVGK